MASTSLFSPVERLRQRRDLVVRRLPEIRMCMIYRPRPARIVTLNPSSWVLFEACDGATLAEIEDACTRVLAGSTLTDVRRGLQELVDLALVETCGEDCVGAGSSKEA